MLLEGVELATGGPVEGEATTPTGAALVRVLAAGPPPAHWRLGKGGGGAGERGPEHYPNAVRVLLAGLAGEAGRGGVLGTRAGGQGPRGVGALRHGGRAGRARG